MIAQAKHKPRWFISIGGEGDHDDRPLVRRTTELGGDGKTGLEVHYSPYRNPTNRDLLREVQDIARAVGRPIATPDDTRRFHNIT